MTNRESGPFLVIIPQPSKTLETHLQRSLYLISAVCFPEFCESTFENYQLMYMWMVYTDWRVDCVWEPFTHHLQRLYYYRQFVADKKTAYMAFWLLFERLEKYHQTN